METTTSYWGNSLGFRIPRNLQEISNITDKTRIRIEAEPDKLIITKIKEPRKYPTIEELFKDFKGEYEAVEVDWGEPIGEEVW